MVFYELDNLFCFKDFEDLSEGVLALKRDIRYLIGAIDKFSRCPEFSDSDTGITILNSILKDLTSICIEKNLVSALRSNKLSCSDMLSILKSLIDKIYHKKISVSQNIVYLY